jgi:mRNA interferase RelE/StbE
MSYKLVIHPKAEKEIEKLHSISAKNVIKKVFNLVENPRPNGYKKLTNFQSERSNKLECYRIRVGDIRIIYTIEENIITVNVIQVQKRGDIY